MLKPYEVLDKCKYLNLLKMLVCEIIESKKTEKEFDKICRPIFEEAWVKDQREKHITLLMWLPLSP